MISIIIVNWNGQRYLYDCVQSIKDNVIVPYEVIVVDNNSTDGSPDVVAERFPWVRLLRTGDNLGFAGGNNFGARHATGKYILLLNNDTLLHTDLGDALHAMDSDPRIGALGAMMLGGDGQPRVSCQHFPAPFRLWRFASLLHVPTMPWATPSGVPLFQSDIVEGSFLMTPTERWRQLGGMDERNYMYGDDVEYCRALADLGLQTVLCPSIRYTHFGGYDHSRMGYLFGGFRRYHRKFSSNWVRIQADFILRAGLLARIPLYWFRASILQQEPSKLALKHALLINRNWAETLIDAHRYHT
jgi:GT2 family glycosyltransferase